VINPSDLRVVISSSNEGLAEVMRTSLAGAGLNDTPIASTPKQLLEAFAAEEPDALISLVESAESSDHGLTTIRFLRRWEKSPNKYIPIVGASPRRDAPTVKAVINAGGHEYCVLPASGEMLLKKVTSAIFVGFPFIEHPTYTGPCRRRRVDPHYFGAERRTNWTAPTANRQEQEDRANKMLIQKKAAS